MATMAAMQSIIDDTNKNNRERFRRLSRQAIFINQKKLIDLMIW
jgi:hypothetical protein